MRHLSYRGIRPRTWRRRFLWSCMKNTPPSIASRICFRFRSKLRDSKFGVRAEKASAAAKIPRFRSTICRWPDPGPILWSKPNGAERLDNLEAALKQLGDRCRELFRLKLEGHSFRRNSKAAQSGVDEYALYLGFSVPQATGGEIK